MTIFFDQDNVYVGGRPCRNLSLAAGQSAWVHVLSAGYYATRLSWDGERLVARGFVQYRYGDQILLSLSPDACSTRVLAQQQWDYGAGYMLTAIAEPYHTTVWLDGEQSHCIYLPPLLSATLSFSSELGAIALYGPMQSPDHTVNPMYGLLLGLDGTVLFSGEGTSFALDMDWMVVCTYADMRAHRCTTRYGYRDGTFGILAHTCISMNEHTYMSALYPHLFAQALLVGDEDEAKGYLSPSLAAEWQALSEYLGDVATLQSPPYLLPDNVVAWADSKGCGKRFAFTLQDGRIEDICRVDV